MTTTIWIVDREAETVSLCTIYAEYLCKYQRVRALANGEWLDAYEFVG